MRLHVRGKNVDITDGLRRHAEQKLKRLERQLADGTQVELELSTERNPSIADKHIAEATVWAKGSTLRVREASIDMRASIDEVAAKLERQVERYRDKRSRRGRRATPPATPADVPQEPVDVDDAAGAM